MDAPTPEPTVSETALVARLKAWVANHPITATLLGAVLVILLLWKVPECQVETYRRDLLQRVDYNDLKAAERAKFEQDLITAKTSARTTLAQIIGGLALLLGLYFTARNVDAAHKNVRVAQDNLRVTEEGKLTDRFSKAVEMLGSDKLDVRLGGIYALERLARDSRHDHWTVMEVLTAFIREHAPQTTAAAAPAVMPPIGEDTGEPATPTASTPKPATATEVKPATDIQAALTVIGRRKWWEQEKAHQHLDLRHTDLRRADLANAMLDRANLDGASLDGARLIGASLWGAKLNGAKLYDPDRGEDSIPQGLTWEQLSVAFLDDTTILPPEFAKRWQEEKRKRAEQQEQQQQPSPPPEQ